MPGELTAPRVCVCVRVSLEGRAVARAATGMVGGRLGERTVQSAGHCRFVASQPEVACGSDRNGDGTARGWGPGEDAVPRRPWDAQAAAAVERAQRRCVVLRTARPTGGQEANRWKWRRRSDSEGWLERPATHAPPKTSAARRKGPEMRIVEILLKSTSRPVQNTQTTSVMPATISFLQYKFTSLACG